MKILHKTSVDDSRQDILYVGRKKTCGAADSHQASAITGIAREDLESEILTAKDEKTALWHTF